MDKKKKILIVDDEPDIRKVFEARLKASHYQVITASGGQEGYQKAKKEQPDLIILDLMMPDVQGGEVAGWLSEDTETQDIPIIFLTALLRETEGEPQHHANKNNVIFSKTCDMNAFLKKIAEMCR